jgi:hypothetical protein
MKRRTVHATQILAVAVTTFAGCAEGPGAPRGVAGTSSAEVSAAAPAPTATPVTTAPPPSPAAPPERAPSAAAGLRALAEELRRGRGDEAVADQPRYRPLCDADGYPLVGNVAAAKADQGPQPSEFCAMVRKKGKP